MISNVLLGRNGISWRMSYNAVSQAIVERELEHARRRHYRSGGVPVFRTADLNYCPALATAVVITSGRLSSRVSSVPAGMVAERCLLSQ
jgi:hypothetical protein